MLAYLRHNRAMLFVKGLFTRPSAKTVGKPAIKDEIKLSVRRVCSDLDLAYDTFRLNLWPIARKIDDSIRPIEGGVTVYAKDALKFAWVLKQTYRIKRSLDSLPKAEKGYMFMNIDWDYELKQSTRHPDMEKKRKHHQMVLQSFPPEDREKYERWVKHVDNQENKHFLSAENLAEYESLANQKGG